MNIDIFVNERTRIISNLLDNPDENGIYPTTKCYNELDALYGRIVAELARNKNVPCHICGKAVSVNKTACRTCLDMLDVEEE